jgi:hypothetical protein
MSRRPLQLAVVLLMLKMIEWGLEEGVRRLQHQQQCAK